MGNGVEKLDGLPVGVRPGQETQVHVVGRVAIFDDVGQPGHIACNVVVAQHHALGPPSRAARVDQRNPRKEK